MTNAASFGCTDIAHSSFCFIDAGFAACGEATTTILNSPVIRALIIARNLRTSTVTARITKSLFEKMQWKNQNYWIVLEPLRWGRR
jgi:hypothetical protein